MKYVYTLLPIVSIVGCAGPSYTDFRSEVDSFIEEGSKRGIDVRIDSLSITFGKVGAGTVAECYIGYNEIVVDKDYWSKSDPLTREFIIFHELGHCIFRLCHVSKASIMQPYVMSSTKYLADRKNYINELFVGGLPKLGDVSCYEQPEIPNGRFGETENRL